MTDLTGKTAIITGAASGIGAAAARLFVLSGANVIGIDMSGDGLAALSGELGKRFAYEVGDVTDRALLERLVARANSEFGGLDMVVLNAGIDGPMAPILEIALADFDRVLGVNVRAVFEGIQVFGAAMKDRGGSVVITSSVNGLRAFENTSPYTTSKMAVLGLARAAANDLAKYDIRVNTIHPGLIDTPMLQRAEEGLAPGHQAELRSTLSQTVAMKRVGEPEDIARAMLFLASDEAGYVTGQSLVVDGGFTSLLSM